MKITTKYIILIVMLFIFFMIELGVSVYTNSLTLQTDAFHMVSDCLALIIGYISTRLMTRDRTQAFTYGWLRAEIIGGLINSVFLLSICFSLTLEIIHRLTELIKNDAHNDVLAKEIDWVLITAGSGLAVNIFGMILFCKETTSHAGHSHTHSEEEIIEEIGEPTLNYNNYAVLLHILGDALGSVVVIASSLLIKYLTVPWRFYFDPLGSALIVIVIAISSIKLLKKCVTILLHRMPKTINYPEMLDRIQHIPEIVSIHEFHIWPLNNLIVIASLHIKVRHNPTKSLDQLLGEIKDIFHEYGIHSSTIQPEWVMDIPARDMSCSEPICRTDCNTRQCCKIDII